MTSLILAAALSAPLAPAPAVPGADAPTPPAPVAIARPVLPWRHAGPWEVFVIADGETESRILDAEGNLVAGPFATKRFPVTNPRTWSAETPVWYRLAVERDGISTETVFGFAEMLVDHGGLVVNGRRVRVKLGPKELGGNAAPASDDFTDADAWTNGIYRIAADKLALLDVERERLRPEATLHAFQDWSVKGTNFNQRFVVANRHAFLDASGVTCRWHLLLDGEEEDDGIVDLYGLAPGREASFDMIPEAVAACHGGQTVGIRFTFEKEGKIVAADQIDLAASREINVLNAPEGWLSEHLVPGFAKSSVSYEAQPSDTLGYRRVFTTGGAFSGGVRFVFDEDLGSPVAFTRLGCFSDTPLVTRISPCRRPPCAPFAWSEPEEDAAGAPEAACSSAPLVLPPSPVTERGGALSFTSSGEDGGVKSAVRWTVYRDGIVSCRARLSAPSAPAGSRLGFILNLAGDSELGWIGKDIEWFGLGPFATGNGDAEGAFLGRWRREMLGGTFTAESVRGVRYGELTVRTLGAPFTFEAEPTSLALVGEADGEGIVDLSFTLSIADGDLTARAPDGAADLPPLTPHPSHPSPLNSYNPITL